MEGDENKDRGTQGLCDVVLKAAIPTVSPVSQSPAAAVTGPSAPEMETAGLGLGHPGPGRGPATDVGQVPSHLWGSIYSSLKGRLSY